MRFERIEHIDAYNCINACISTLAHHYGKEYFMIAGGNWGLVLDSESKGKRLGERIDIINDFDGTCRTKKFHGFSWNMENVDEKDRNDVTGEFKGYKFPMLVRVDLFELERIGFYQKFHIPHNLIVYSYNADDKCYSCLDPFFEYEEFTLNKDTLLQAMSTCGTLELFPEPKEIELQDYMEAIKEDMDMVGKDNLNYINILRLAEELEENFDIGLEFEGLQNQLHSLPIMDKIRKVAQARYAYCCILDGIYRLYQIEAVKNAATQLKQSVNMWLMLKAKLLKMYLTKPSETDKKAMIQMLKQIAELEKGVVALLQNIL